MQVLTVNSNSLSDFEVLNILKEDFGNHLKTDVEFEDFRTMVHSTKKFLSNEMMPCSVQTKQQIVAATKDLERFNLTKLEKLMLINTRPLSIVEMVPLIEDLEVRFTAKQQEEILSSLKKNLPFERPNEIDEE
jgi:hypothetical protein